ncbi:hypothetical protein [Tenacibaculum sp. M341]|uniref:hypothetical protein n=1 Tax=Tenacibaculum sp. M341 TaxID=2530339 RepID=UPI001044FB66|nr:hypothetical protein [Tenacibaculum sp. M341]TCI92216.1 hypothetical protein EYW44_08525 [Tenacibaculum sp. M341]
MGKNVKIRFSDFVNFHGKEDKIGVSYVDKGTSIAVNSNNSNLRNRFIVINPNSSTEKTQLVFNDRVVSDGYSFYVKNTQDTDVEIASTFASVNDLTAIKPGELGKVFYDKKNQKVYVELLGGAASSSSGIEGIKSTGTIANKDNEVIIGDDSLGGYVSISYSKGNRFYGENIFSDGYSIESYDASPEIKFDAFYSSSNGGNISHFGRNLDYFTYGKGGLDVNNYFFDFNFTEGFKIKQRVNQNSFKEAAIKTGLLTTNQDYQLPNKSITFAGLTDIPKVQAGTNITIDNSDPLKPVINASSGEINNNFINGLYNTGNNVKLGGVLSDQFTDLKFDDSYSGESLRIIGSKSDGDMFIINNVGSSGHSGSSDGIEGDPETQGIVLSTAGYIEQRALSGLIDMQALAFKISTRNPHGFTGYGYDESIVLEALNPTDPNQGYIHLKTKKLLAPDTEITDITEPKNLITKEYADANYSGGGTSTTDLSYTAAPDKGTVVSSTGIDAVIPIADKTNAGLMKADFYEEGTFTPRLTGGNGSYTVGASNCNFVRIGNNVSLSIVLMEVNSTGSPNATFVIEDTPFEAAYPTCGMISKFTGTNLSENEVSSLGVTVAGGNFKRLQFQNKHDHLPTGITFTNGTIVLQANYITNVYKP